MDFRNHPGYAHGSMASTSNDSNVSSAYQSGSTRGEPMDLHSHSGYAHGSNASNSDDPEVSSAYQSGSAGCEPTGHDQYSNHAYPSSMPISFDQRPSPESYILTTASASGDECRGTSVSQSHLSYTLVSAYGSHSAQDSSPHREHWRGNDTLMRCDLLQDAEPFAKSTASYPHGFEAGDSASTGLQASYTMGSPFDSIAAWPPERPPSRPCYTLSPGEHDSILLQDPAMQTVLGQSDPWTVEALAPAEPTSTRFDSGTPAASGYLDSYEHISPGPPTPTFASYQNPRDLAASTMTEKPQDSNSLLVPMDVPYNNTSSTQLLPRYGSTDGDRRSYMLECFLQMPPRQPTGGKQTVQSSSEEVSRRSLLTGHDTRSTNRIMPHSESSQGARSAQYKCKGCDKKYSGEYARGNLARHKRQKHGDEGVQLFHCEHPPCPKVFHRQDARLKHYRRKHPELAPNRLVLRKSGHESSMSGGREAHCKLN